MADYADFEDEVSASWHAPATVAEAVSLLAELGEDAKLFAGGQSLLVLKRMGLVSPTALISLQRIPDLTQITATSDGGISIGAMVTQHSLEHAADIRNRYTALAEAAAVVASPPVRRRGTIGGNICHADPTGDPPAALIALDATVRIAGSSGVRSLPVAALFTDFMETAVEPGEILISIDLPAPTSNSGSAYLKHRLRGVDTALVGVGASIALAADGTCASARIGVVGAAPTPFRANGAEAALTGQPLNDATIAAAAKVAAAESNPLSDTEGSEWYRREMVDVFVRRAVAGAYARAVSA